MHDLVLHVIHYSRDVCLLRIVVSQLTIHTAILQTLLQITTYIIVLVFIPVVSSYMNQYFQVIHRYLTPKNLKELSLISSPHLWPISNARASKKHALM